MMDSYSTRPLSPNVSWDPPPDSDADHSDLPDEPEPDHLSDAE